MATDKNIHNGTLSLLVDLNSGRTSRMEEITLVSAGLKERQDLQRWITTHPDLIAPGLLLITTEFDRWEVRDQKVADRLDALFLDTGGALVVAEFKRDRAVDTVELQALKYAAYCSQLTLDELAEEYATTHDLTTDEGHQHLLDHAPALEDRVLRSVKIRLIAGSFGPAVTSVVLWLREYDVDIGCIEIATHRVPGSGHAVISSRQLLPLPEAEDYLVRRRRKEQEEDRAREGPAECTWQNYETRFPAHRVAVARRLFDELTRYVQEHQTPWTPVLRGWWLGYQRPDTPERLGLENPYPNLKSWWHAGSRQWNWAVPTVSDVPEVSLAVAISHHLQPQKGPMPRPPEPELPV
jgi:hypothetical protein